MHSTSSITTHILEYMDMPYQCGKCNSDMEEGFLLEMGEGNCMSSQTWVEGKFERSFFMGAKLKGKAVYEVKTFRCIACGFLDSYALEKR